MKKRVISLLLILCMLCSVLPVPALAASSQTVYVAFTSDVHSKTTNASDSGHSPYRLNNWISNVSQAVGMTFDNMVFCGDSADGTGASNGTDFWNKVQTVMDVAASNSGLKGNGLFLAGNHEWENGKLDSATHEAAQKIQKVGTKVVSDHYVLYLFGASSSSQSGNGFKPADITALDQYLSTAPDDRPIFIASHFPIHNFSNRSTANASSLIDTLNKYGDELDIYFIWGHNHSQSDNNYDKFYDDDDKLLNKQINFVYCAAGCMSDSEYVGSSSVKGKGMVAKIVDGRVESLTYYGKEFSVVGSAYKPVYSQKPETNNVTWSLNNGVLTISGTGAMEDYSAQGSPWYASADSITSIVVQKGITRIGANAFYGCSKAVSASIANTVTSIGNSAFYHCQKLESITIPSSVTSIDHHAFNSCYSLAKIQIPSSVNSIGNRLFMNCVGLTEVSLPNSLNAITEGMFSNCETLPFVEIPASVTTIGISAFSGCEVMKEIVLPTSVKSIGKLAFQDCYGLETVVIPASVTSIGENIFNASPEVTDVYFGGTKTAWNALDCDVPEDCLVHYSTTSSKNHWQHKTIAATCKEQGYTADVCGCGYIRNKVSTGGALGDHDWGNWLTIESATCNKEGTQRRDCNVCDAYETKKVEQLSHQYQTVVTTPTCTQQGYTTYTCSCGDSYIGNYVDETGHNYASKVTAPSCTEKGYTTYTCSCGDSYIGNYVDETGHNYASKVTAPSCTEKGYTTYTCSCGDTYKDNYVDKTGHSYASKVTAPTCTAKGYTTYTCHCGDTYTTNEVKALGHNEVADKGYAATCTKEGLTDGTHCDRCNTVLLAQAAIAATGHSWDAGKVTTEPTEETTGVRAYTCDTCGATKTESIPVLEHTHKYTSAVTAPTCTEKGYTTYICACGDTYIANEVAALGHEEVTDNGYAATCTEDGLGEGSHCSACKEVIVAQVIIEATGHSYTEGICETCGDKDPDYTEEKPTEPEEDNDVLIISDEQTISNQTINSDVYITSTGRATFNNVIVDGDIYCHGQLTTNDCTAGDVYAYAYGSMLSCDAFDGTHGLVTGSITCNRLTITDDALDYAFEKWGVGTDIPPEEHVHQYNSVVSAPTCTGKGYTTYTCTCGDSYVADYVNATGHDFVGGECTVCGTTDPDYVPSADLFELYGANMLLGNNLAMNFYIEPADLEFGEDYYAVITKTYADREDLEIIIEDDEWEEAYNMYRVSLDKIAAKEMADEITVVIYNDEDEQVSKTWVDSVRDYTMRVLVKEEAKTTSDKELLALYVEMLNYGAAAQDHFNYNEDDLANNELTAAQQAYGLGTVEMEDFRVEGTGYVGTNLTLESNILMNFFFNNIPAEHDDMYAIATYTDHYGEAKQVKVEGEDFVQHNSTTWKISVSGLVIADCRQLVDVKVYNSENALIASATDSIESYTARKNGDGPLFIAIMKFAVAAYNSFH